MEKRICKWLTIVLCAVFTLPGMAQVPSETREYNGEPLRSARAKPTGRIIVKWRGQARALDPAARSAKASIASGLALRARKPTAAEYEALEAENPLSLREVEAAAARLATDPDVELAVPEYMRKPHALTNDPLLTEQWYLLSAQPSATRTDSAWDVTQGSSTIIVAVLDTGVRFEHPDLQGKLLDGYDFISDPVIANDGDGRDADASDPGDWVTLADVQQNPNDVLDEDCLSDSGGPRNSSWHGTRVAGLVGAQTNNGDGVAGNAWNTRILPLRVLGKCGGRDLDIIDAMRWAAGIPVDGIANPTPAHIINLSLGGEGPCHPLYQQVVAEITARGVLIVASAGNEGVQVSAPANCNGVLGVTGLRHIGTKVGFSNLGPQVGIAAPGGNCVNVQIGQPCLFSIVVATNTGSTTPAASSYSDALNYNVGTSFSAPMVASAAALLLAVNPTLTPAQTIALLKDSATPFPVNPAVQSCRVPTSSSAPQLEECNCTTETCGAGMLNTGAAIAAALRPLAVITTNGNIAPGATIGIDGSSSFSTQGRSIVTYQWSVHDVTGTTPTIADANAQTTTLSIPAETQFTLRLTVTDDQGAHDTKDLALSTV
ncbi:MAG TPA: S8 family serine peptidase, partial [Steroidobacteraceae bacterium]